MANTPTDIARQSLDAIAIDYELGDIEQGGRVANVTLRAYGECRKKLLRAVPWAFARKQVPLVLLADATGNTPNVLTTTPGSQFIYEYAYPIDIARIRYIPWNPVLNSPPPAGNIAIPATPTMTALTQPPFLGQPVRPSRYLVTNDPNIVPQNNANFLEVQGQSPQGSTVILSNVQNATCVYTFDALYPSVWDHLFRDAMVAVLASEIALPLWVEKDRKFGLQLRDDQIKLAREKIVQARIADGNEMVVSTDHIPDWINARNSGGAWGAGNGGPGTVGPGIGDFGCWGNGWAGSMAFCNGSAF